MDIMLAYRHRPAFGPQSKMWVVRLDPQLLADQPRDLAAVGPALGLAHHVPHDRTDRLGVALADTLRRVGVGGQRRGHDLAQLVSLADRLQALSPHDLRRVATLGHEPIEHLPSRAD